MAETWRRRWDSFHLVTPNWTLSLPGAPYDGDDPEGFVARDEIVAYLERYAAGLPVRTGVAVNSVEPGDGAGFLLRTSDGDLSAEAVIICTGAYQRPHRPTFEGRLPPEVTVLDAEGYHNPAALPAGRVMVVGSGQTGCQISEELCESGREVFLACGRAGWGPRRLDGRDIVTWLAETSWFRTPVSALPTPQARLLANIQATGKAGGHDLHYRTLQAMGVQLLGRLTGVEGHRAGFADDLIDELLGVTPATPPLASCSRLSSATARRAGPNRRRCARPRLDLDLRGFGAVIFTSGFRPDYGRGYSCPRSTPWAFLSPSTEPARSSPDCTSAVSTSCGQGRPPCRSGSGRTPASSRTRRPVGSAEARTGGRRIRGSAWAPSRLRRDPPTR